VKKFAVLLYFVLWAFSVATAQDVKTQNLDISFTRALAGKHSLENINTQLQQTLVQYEHDKAYPRWDYKNNQAIREALVDIVKTLASKENFGYIVVIEGAASPVGSEAYNQALALRRATILKQIISEMEGGDKLKIHAISRGEDWATFAQYIHNEYHKANRAQVLAILDSDDTNDNKERKLYALDKGRTWQLLVKEYMGPARNAAVIHIVESEPLAESLCAPHLLGEVEPIELILTSEATKEIKPSEEVSSSETAPITKSTTEQDISEKTTVEQPARIPVVALRSNLLVPALNVGVEVPIGNHWSVGADYYFPWIWPKRDNKDCFEFLGWGIEGRYWFGKSRTAFDRLQGHSVGLYGYMGYYDFERNYHGHQGEFVNVGVDYTYAMAVGKKRSVHFEFSLGVGYIYSQARKYTVIEAGAPLISDKITKKVRFFGPTKANISLVVPIFQKVKPNDKMRGDE
jgi:hypothetical protein